MCVHMYVCNESDDIRNSHIRTYIATYIYCIMHLHAYFKLDFSKYIVISRDHYNDCIDISLLVCYVRVWYDFAILWQAHMQTLVFSILLLIVMIYTAPAAIRPSNCVSAAIIHSRPEGYL